MELDELIVRAEQDALDDTPLARVASAARLSAELSTLGDQLVDHFVDDARRNGCSWAQIGSVLGVTRQGAQQRYGGLLRGLIARKPFTITRVRSDTRAAVVEAQTAARRLGHAHVDTDHLLFGLLAVGPDAPGCAILEDVGVNRVEVEDELVKVAGRHTVTTSGHIPFAPGAKKTLELAFREALRLDQHHIGTEHLLLALLLDRAGVVAGVLGRHGVDRKGVLAAIESLPPRA
jgi:Clp amino terminal domain, pathogenicity island component